MPDSVWKNPATRTATTLLALLTFFVLTHGATAAADSLRDPTRPYTHTPGAPAAAPRFVVNAIIVSPERRVAIVNGRRVTVGASVGDATVVAIEKNRVVLDIGGKRWDAELQTRALPE